MNSFVCDLVWDGDNLYSAGLFTTAGGKVSSRIARWAPCPLPSGPAITSVVDADPCALTGVTITFTGGTPATHQDLYVDGILQMSGITSPVTYFPGDMAGHHYLIRAVNGESTCVTDSEPASGTDAICAPAEATALTWSLDKLSLGWTAPVGTAPVAGYHLYRGIQADLPNLMNGGTDSCTRYDGSDTSVNLAADDPSESGGLYWYLVTAYNGAGEGPAGSATEAPRIVNSSGPCL